MRKITTIAMLMACEIILSRFLSIQAPTIKISFAFVAIVIVAMLYGPLWAGVSAALCDLLGALLFPVAEFFPGFTLTAFLTGLTFGLFLQREKVKPLHIVAAAFIVTFILQLGLDTLWLNILMGEAFFALLPARAIKSLIMLAIQFIAITLIAKNINRLKIKV